MTAARSRRLAAALRCRGFAIIETPAGLRIVPIDTAAEVRT